MNLNRKIKGIASGGMPGYNRKLDEILEAVNWLLGIRTINGTKISEDTTGPVIDLSQSKDQSAVNQPWSKTPDGETAGWIKHDVCVSGTTVAKWFWGQTT